MNEVNKEKKAKLIPNSERENNFNNESEKIKVVDEQFNDTFENFSYNFSGIKRISGWWILGFIVILFSIPIALIYLIYISLKTVLSFIF